MNTTPFSIISLTVHNKWYSLNICKNIYGYVAIQIQGPVYITYLLMIMNSSNSVNAIYHEAPEKRRLHVSPTRSTQSLLVDGTSVSADLTFLIHEPIFWSIISPPSSYFFGKWSSRFIGRLWSALRHLMIRLTPLPTRLNWNRLPYFGRSLASCSSGPCSATKIVKGCVCTEYCLSLFWLYWWTMSSPWKGADTYRPSTVISRLLRLCIYNSNVLLIFKHFSRRVKGQ